MDLAKGFQVKRKNLTLDPVRQDFLAPALVGNGERDIGEQVKQYRAENNFLVFWKNADSEQQRDPRMPGCGGRGKCASITGVGATE